MFLRYHVWSIIFKFYTIRKVCQFWDTHFILRDDNHAISNWPNTELSSKHDDSQLGNEQYKMNRLMSEFTSCMTEESFWNVSHVRSAPVSSLIVKGNPLHPFFADI